MIKAVIFDFDGTLTNRQRNAYGVFNEYARHYFSEMSDIEFEAVLQDFLYYDCNGTIPVSRRVIPLLDKYGKYLPENFVEEFEEHYYEYMFRHTHLKPETLDILKKLKGNYKMAILSNGDSKSQHDKIVAVNIEDYFDEVIVTGDYGIHKPDPAIFVKVAEMLGVKCEECMMVGDVFSTDILGAIKAKMLPVWFAADYEKPSRYYDGYRIDKLDEIFEILEKENRN